MKPVGKPDAGNPHVRFDERGGETDRSRETAPLLDLLWNLLLAPLPTTRIPGRSPMNRAPGGRRKFRRCRLAPHQPLASRLLSVRGAFICDPVGNGPAEVGRAVSATLRLRRGSAPAADGALGEAAVLEQEPWSRTSAPTTARLSGEAGLVESAPRGGSAPAWRGDRPERSGPSTQSGGGRRTGPVRPGAAPARPLRRAPRRQPGHCRVEAGAWPTRPAPLPPDHSRLGRR